MLRDYQAKLIYDIRAAWQNGARFVCAVMPTGCHAKGAKILMHDGMVKPVENIKIGDMLMGPGGDVRFVTELHQGRDLMYQIIPVKGDPFIVNRKHILSLKRTNDHAICNISVNEYLQKSATFKHVHKLWRAPIGLPIEIVTGFDIEPVGFDDYFGFSVTGDQLYLTDDFTVHHNSGKSVVMRNIVRDTIGASIMIAHRQELVSQLSTHLAAEQVVHKIIAPQSVISNITKIHREEFGRSFYNPSSIAAVASVDTLMSRGPEPWMNQVRLWLCDEAAHLLLENKWGKAVTMFPNACGLGVTATPTRADGKGLGANSHGVFNAMVLGPTMRELIASKYLAEYEIVVPQSGFDASKLTIGSTGDYTPKSLRAESRRSQITGDIVANYKQWADGMQAITFVTDVETSDETAKRFTDAGIPAVSLHAGTSDYDRFHTIKAFRNRDVRILVNVGLFDEGFDVPGVEAVIMARPTKSLGLYLQQIGRGLRPASGKSRALIIDHVHNVMEHGLPDKPQVWTLTARDKRQTRDRDPDDIPLARCESCQHVYERIYRACPRCGFEPTPAARSGPEQVDGDMTLLDLDTLAKLRAASTLEDARSLAERVGAAAGPVASKGAFNRQQERINTQQALAEEIAAWAGVWRDRGISDSEMYRRFYFMVGCDVLTALSGTTSEMQSVMERIKS